MLNNQDKPKIDEVSAKNAEKAVQAAQEILTCDAETSAHILTKILC